MTMDILDWRYNYTGEARAESNPLMWMEGGAWRRLNHDEKISKTIFNFTASVGIIGFNEALNYMYLNNGYEVDNLPNYKSGEKRQQDQIKFMEVLNSIKEFRNIRDAVRIDEDGIQTRVWDEEGNFIHPDPDKKYLEVYEGLDTTRKTTIIPRMYSVYGTPAESLVYKMMKQLQEQYGFINSVTAQEDGKGRNYITNSFHQPVWVESNVFDKIDFEAPFHLDKMASGGHISQNEFAFGTAVTVLEQVVRYAMEKGMYYGINIASSHCFDCGWNGETADTCVECNSENVVTIQRICGYMSITSRNGHSVVNAGKTEELLERVNHVGNAKKEYTKNFEKKHDIQRDVVSKEFSMFESGE
jgi:ribonucleoside-triphosphate reductase|nr:MAG TPA: anaerobic ribonucleoside triphosphate reductase [Caudoviricetes sp.]